MRILETISVIMFMVSFTSGFLGMILLMLNFGMKILGEQ